MQLKSTTSYRVNCLGFGNKLGILLVCSKCALKNTFFKSRFLRGTFFRLKGVIAKSVSFMFPARMANDQDKILVQSLLGKI